MEVKLAHGVMEGKGSYNKHAKVPAGGATVALPFLEKAVQAVRLDPGDQPIVIVDYGSSQGKNSMAPMQFAVRGLRKRVVRNRPICVFHIDQPSNDFNSLFEVLAVDPGRYTLDDPYVFPAAIGRSFYENVVPAGSVHLGWSCYAAVWLSRVPALIPGHFVALFSSGSVRAEFERQAATDWEAFLSLRAQELRPGGRLVVVLPGVDDDGLSGFEPIFQQANAVLEEMVDEGILTSEERSGMAIGGYPRCKRELLAPFDANGTFQGLTVEHCGMSELPDAAWADFQRDGDIQALAVKHALFFRSVFVPSMASALAGVRSGGADTLVAFADQVEQRLKRRMADLKAATTHSFVQTMVLAKAERA